MPFACSVQYNCKWIDFIIDVAQLPTHCKIQYDCKWNDFIAVVALFCIVA